MVPLPIPEITPPDTKIYLVRTIYISKVDILRQLALFAYLSITRRSLLERVSGVEPPFLPWEGNVEPINYTRIKIQVKYTKWKLNNQIVTVHGSNTKIIVRVPTCRDEN